MEITELKSKLQFHGVDIEEMPRADLIFALKWSAEEIESLHARLSKFIAFERRVRGLPQ